MKGIKRFCLVLGMLLLLFSVTGCADNSEDVMATVNGIPVYRWYYEAYLDKQLALYQQYYGKDLDAPGNAKEFREFKEYRLEDLIGEAALKNKATELGLYELTAEQEAEIEQEYQAYYNSRIDEFMQEYGTDQAGRKKAEQALDESLKKSGLNLERIRQTFVDNYVLDLLFDELAQMEEVPEDEIRAEYDALLEKQQEKCEEDPDYLGAHTPLIPVYIPEGYSKVLLWQVPFSLQQQTKLQDAQAVVQQAAAEYLAAASESGEESAAAGSKKNALDSATTAYQNILKKACDEIRPQAQALLDEVNAGADFKTLAQTKSGEGKTYFDYIFAKSTHVEPGLRDAALALQNPGDVGPLVDTQNGIYLLYLEEKLTPGVVPFEQVKDEIKEDIITSQKVVQSTKIRSEYAKKADEDGLIVRYPDRL